jgi:hypothetical protein
MNIQQVTNCEKHSKKVWCFHWDAPIICERHEMLAQTRREANLKRNTLSTQVQDDPKPKTKGNSKNPGFVLSYLDYWQK